MQALLTTTRNTSLALRKRAFTSSARSWQAVPQQKPVLMKEFKIYRWVRFTNPNEGFPPRSLPICLIHVHV